MSPIANRLSKNWQRLKPWADRNQIEAFRLYDRDIPEYPFVIEVFGRSAVLWNRQDPVIDAGKEGHLSAALNGLADLGFLTANVIVKKREVKARRTEQYGPLQRREIEVPVRESSFTFLVNLYDYIDCGLFLDHRLFRRTVGDEVGRQARLLTAGETSPLESLPLRMRGSNSAAPSARGSSSLRVLNLFCYTGSISVYAARAGAQTTNVDLSGRYLEWAERNFAANNILTKNHRFIESDVLSWVKDGSARTFAPFDVIICDPPTFSNSKRMVGTWDVERDHVWLIESVCELLETTGVLFFSTNRRGFRIDSTLTERFKVTDISAKTLPKDFHDEKIRSAFRIEHKEPNQPPL